MAALTNLWHRYNFAVIYTLWRAVDFHRSGRRGLSQKTAFVRRGLSEGKFSNYYSYIVLDTSIFDGQRATLRPGVIGDLEKAWEVSSSSAEEAEEEPENLELETAAPKATWGGSSSGPKEPPFPPPPSRLRPAEPSFQQPLRGRNLQSPHHLVLGRLQLAQQQIFREQSSHLHFLQRVQHTVQQFLGSQQAKPKALIFSKPVQRQPLRPWILFPDTCLYYTWVNSRLTDTSTRDFEGTLAIRPELQVNQKLVLALDYH